MVVAYEAGFAYRVRTCCSVARSGLHFACALARFGLGLFGCCARGVQGLSVMLKRYRDVMSGVFCVIARVLIRL